jgi:pyruvate formate lyase activating enzyme
VKQALYYQKKEQNIAKCKLCPRACDIKQGGFGLCGARKNIKGKLYSVVYARPCAMHVDPIEKKPFYHFLPGSTAFSIATNGCNFFCKFCQNWQISQERNNSQSFEGLEEVSPEEVVKLCIKEGCKIISYTYTEPTIFFEYMLDTAKIAKKQKIKNTIVSNGYISEAPLRELCKYIDAANIDLKGFTEEFYKEECKATLAPVLQTLKILKQEKVWLEITNLLIPGLNDDMKIFEKMCAWIEKELGRDVPLHISRFHPDYKVQNIKATSIESLKQAQAIAQKHLDYVYVGNIAEESNTYCPKCKNLLIERSMMATLGNKIMDGKCSFCGKEISGVWE